MNGARGSKRVRGGVSAVIIVVSITICSCGATAPQHRMPAPDVATTNAAKTWAAVTQSPWRPTHEEEHDPRESRLLQVCGAKDLALTRVAREIAHAHARGEAAPDPDSLITRLRMVGEPHVRPRLFVAKGRAPIDTETAHATLARRVSSALPRMRCGIAFETSESGSEVLVAVEIEALADMRPMPVRGRTGEWFSFEGTLNVPARSASLLILGPHGAPRTVPAAFDLKTGIVRGRFALDQPGEFLVQLVGDLEDGPRPVLEAHVFADTPPRSTEDGTPSAPGEEAVLADDDALALAQMLAQTRATEGLHALARDKTLDTLAQAHAEHMRDRRIVAHDLGDGDFLARLERNASYAQAVGENVAHAKTARLAHRAFYASPSHRLNLINAFYTHFGIGVARADDGSIYVCETFARTQPP